MNTVETMNSKELEKLFNKIVAMSKSLKLAQKHAALGLNTGDIIYDLVYKVDEQVKPSIANLCDDDKEKLLQKLQKELDTDIKKQHSDDLLLEVINFISISLGKEKNKVRKLVK